MLCNYSILCHIVVMLLVGSNALCHIMPYCVLLCKIATLNLNLQCVSMLCCVRPCDIIIRTFADLMLKRALSCCIQFEVVISMFIIVGFYHFIMSWHYRLDRAKSYHIRPELRMQCYILL